MHGNGAQGCLACAESARSLCMMADSVAQGSSSIGRQIDESSGGSPAEQANALER